jgi:hypothetical protein
MHRVRQDELPFVGSSHQFVGAEHGDVNVSMQVDALDPAIHSGEPGGGVGVR